MRNLLRQPLAWMVLAECIVVVVLVLLVWSLVASAAAQHPGDAQVQNAGPPAASSTSPSPDLPETAPTKAPPQLPGLNLDAGFWRIRLGQLNRDQVTIEQIEWHLVHNATDTMQRYLETVVLPAITRAERPA
jgi:hypothetical protein